MNFFFQRILPFLVTNYNRHKRTEQHQRHPVLLVVNHNLAITNGPTQPSATGAASSKAGSAIVEEYQNEFLLVLRNLINHQTMTNLVLNGTQQLNDGDGDDDTLRL